MTVRPSSFNQHPWIYADDPNLVGREANPEVIGKWLVFVKEADVDAVWETVAGATVSGRLGTAAKSQLPGRIRLPGRANGLYASTRTTSPTTRT